MRGQISEQAMRDLIKCEIVELRGISGKPTTVDIAKHAPQVIQMHAMSGRVYDLTGYGDGVFFTSEIA